MFRQSPENSRKAIVPLIPVVTSGADMKFVLEMSLFEKLCKLAVRRQQSLLIAAGQEQVWCLFRVNRTCQDEWIIVALGLAIPWTED